MSHRSSAGRRRAIGRRSVAGVGRAAGRARTRGGSARARVHAGAPSPRGGSRGAFVVIAPFEHLEHAAQTGMVVLDRHALFSPARLVCCEHHRELVAVFAIDRGVEMGEYPWDVDARCPVDGQSLEFGESTHPQDCRRREPGSFGGCAEAIGGARYPWATDSVDRSFSAYFTRWGVVFLLRSRYLRVGLITNEFAFGKLRTNKGSAPHGDIGSIFPLARVPRGGRDTRRDTRCGGLENGTGRHGIGNIEWLDNQRRRQRIHPSSTAAS